MILFYGLELINRYIATENTRAYCIELWRMKLRVGCRWLRCTAFPSTARWDRRQNSLTKRIRSVTWTLILGPFLPTYPPQSLTKRISSSLEKCYTELNWYIRDQNKETRVEVRDTTCNINHGLILNWFQCLWFMNNSLAVVPCLVVVVLLFCVWLWSLSRWSSPYAWVIE